MTTLDDDDGPSLFLLSQTVTDKLGGGGKYAVGSSHTGSKSLDSLLSLKNGTLWNGLTEICGPPGVGKTQIALSLCVNAILSTFDGDSSATVSRILYVDTEGTAMPDRIRQIIISNLEERYPPNAATKPEVVRTAMANFTIMRICTYAELIAMTNVLPDYLRPLQDTKICMVVFDSVASPMRPLAQDLPLRSKLLGMIGQGMISAAARFNVPIIVTNSMTTKISNTSGDKGVLIPALGEAWAQLIGSRLILYWRDKTRYAFLHKAAPHLRSRENSSVPFSISKEGIRDIPTLDSGFSQPPPTQLGMMTLSSSQPLTSDDLLEISLEAGRQKRKLGDDELV